jgi:inner membrane protein
MIEQLHNPIFLWSLVGVIMLVIEFTIPGFVIFFFGLGALLVAFLCFLLPTLSINAQLVIFIITSLLLLLLLRKWFKSIFSGFFNKKEIMPKNIESYIGETATVIEKISKNSPGKIEFHGTSWKAIAEVDIECGENIVIIKQNNLTFEVKKYNI